MPFDFDSYRVKCASMTNDELHKQHHRYVRHVASSSTTITIDVFAAIPTAGMSLLGIGFYAPRLHNAIKKLEIIEDELFRRGLIRQVRRRDVAGAIALSGTIGTISVGAANIVIDCVEEVFDVGSHIIKIVRKII